MKYRPCPKYKDSGIEWLGEVPEDWEIDYNELRPHSSLGDRTPREFTEVSCLRTDCPIKAGRIMSKRLLLTLLPIIVLILDSYECNAQSGWSWQRPLPTGGDLWGVQLINASTAVAVGDGGIILRTTDCGINWAQQSFGKFYAFRGISFSDANTGTVVGERGKIFRTTDGGQTWVPRLSGIRPDLNGVSHMDALNIMAAGYEGVILRSTDGGEHWEHCGIDPKYILFSISYIAANTAVAVGTWKTIFLTTDNGENWTMRYNSGVLEEAYFNVSFSDESSGTAVGSWGAIVHSSDGGLTWYHQASGTTNTLIDVTWGDPANGTIVGDFGTILRTTNGGVTWVEDIKPAPSLFRLGQNYPNPVITGTTIPFSITKPEHVTLSIYNMLGRQIAVLVDEAREMGSHSVPFDATGLQSGMYFYVLRTGSTVETRKMLVMNPAVGY